MIIGILTYHYALNYGAVLQCFALKTALEKQGNEVLVINYEDENQYKNSSMYNHGSGLKKVLFNFLLLPFHCYRKKKQSRFRAFAMEYLNATERITCEQELINHINKKKYDFVFVGSDQVWNPNIKDFTSVYFLPFEMTSKKVAYAASFGNATFEQLHKYKKWIKDFDNISLREEKFYEQICELNNTTTVVPDPVFLLTESEWKSLIIKDDTICREPYLLCYFMNKKNAHTNYLEAEKIAKELGLKVVRLNPSFSLDSLSKNSNLDAGPKEFINYLYYADFICTDSFHGTAFSIIFKKNFYVIEKVADKTDARKSYLLGQVGMKKRLISKYSKDLVYSINYYKYADKILSMTEKGYLFLNTIIEKKDL